MVDRWVSLAAALEGSGLAAWLRSSAWGYPAVETLHILGLALLVGAAVAFDVRLLGAASRIAVPSLARLLLPVARVGFTLAVLSGLVLFVMQARTFALMPLFFIKMAAIAVAAVNTVVFHRGIYASAEEWGLAMPAPPAARAAAVVSLLGWTLALVCGRFLAYV